MLLPLTHCHHSFFSHNYLSSPIHSAPIKGCLDSSYFQRLPEAAFNMNHHTRSLLPLVTCPWVKVIMYDDFLLLMSASSYFFDILHKDPSKEDMSKVPRVDTLENLSSASVLLVSKPSSNLAQKVILLGLVLWCSGLSLSQWQQHPMSTNSNSGFLTSNVIWKAVENGPRLFHPHERLGCSSWLLTLTWHIPGHYRYSEK